MKAVDIMTKDVISVTGDETVEAAAKLMFKHNIGSLPVVENGTILGILTESDFIGKWVEVPRGVASIPELLGELFDGVSAESVLKDARKRPVKELMSKDLIFLNPDTSLTDIVKLMMNENINRFPVIENGKLVGIVARRDILGTFNKLEKI